MSRLNELNLTEGSGKKKIGLVVAFAIICLVIVITVGAVVAYSVITSGKTQERQPAREEPTTTSISTTTTTTSMPTTTSSTSTTIPKTTSTFPTTTSIRPAVTSTIITRIEPPAPSGGWGFHDPSHHKS